MKKIHRELRGLIVVTIFSGVLASCSTMNSRFQCNATAWDSCLTIEQVDEMTNFADEIHYRRVYKAPPKKSIKKPCLRPRYVNAKNSKEIWVAPWVDANGKKHQGGRDKV